MSDHKDKLKAILREIESDNPVDIGTPTQSTKTTIIHGDHIQAGGDVFADRHRTVIVNKPETLPSKKQKSGRDAELTSLAGLCFLILLSLSLAQTPAPNSAPQIPIQPVITYQEGAVHFHKIRLNTKKWGGLTDATISLHRYTHPSV